MHLIFEMKVKKGIYKMNNEQRKAIFIQAEQWVLEAGGIIRDRLKNPIKVDSKSNTNDLVTEVDKEIELYFAEKIKRNYPEDLLLGEEGYGDDVTSLDGIVWIIDPIDGTMNFVHLKKDFAISVGIFHDGIGEIGLIYDVMADELYSAKRGEGAYKNDVKLGSLSKGVKFQDSIISFNHDLLIKSSKVHSETLRDLVLQVRGTRIVGAAALDIAYVAEGLLEGYYSEGLSPWDIAAGLIILKEVFGKITRVNGEEINILERGTVLACNSALQSRLLIEKTE